MNVALGGEGGVARRTARVGLREMARGQPQGGVGEVGGRKAGWAWREAARRDGRVGRRQGGMGASGGCKAGRARRVAARRLGGRSGEWRGMARQGGWFGSGGGGPR